MNTVVVPLLGMTLRKLVQSYRPVLWGKTILGVRPETMSNRAVLAPIHRRIVAYGIDILMSFVALVGIQVMLFPINPLLGATGPTNELLLHAWVTLTVTIPLLLFFGISWASNASATPGMRIMGLRVRTTTGPAVTRGRALLRALVLLIPFELNHVVMFYPHPIWDDATPGFRIGFIAVYFVLLVYLVTAFATARRQGPHDFVAKTIVVRGAAAERVR